MPDDDREASFRSWFWVGVFNALVVVAMFAAAWYLTR